VPVVRSVWQFALVAVVVTLTPGPATATVLHVTVRHGRRTALGVVVGNSVGVLAWGVLAALGVSALVLASEVAYLTLKIAGAAFLVYLGIRAWLRRDEPDTLVREPRRVVGWRIGLVASLTNPKLAVFFLALFPQFLDPHAAVLPWALAMAASIVAVDVLWFSTLTYLVERAGWLLRPRVRRITERLTGTVMLGLGFRLAVASRP
jgi:threonine/homoserine/homoserine lactone efflux protein